MLAISLWQPWASLVAFGIKRFETRSWRPSWSGERIAIHASKRWTPDQADFTNRLIREYPDQLTTLFFGRPENIPLGGIVATAILKGCLPTTTILAQGISPLERAVGDWAEGRWAWMLDEIEMIKPPIACTGHQGFFYVANPYEPADM